MAVSVGQAAGEADEAVDFRRDIYPLLQRSCFECHADKLQEGGLRLDLRSAALESGSIEPHHADASELLRRVALPAGHEDIMPAIGEPLAKHQVDLLRRWIDQGAPWPEEFEPGPHWAYVAPVRPQLPEVTASRWPASPLDRFVLRRLESNGLAPSGRAAPEKLVRRVYLDLIGLPPTPAEVAAFTSNPTQSRLTKLVDELLDRPQFGERWARHWLDLARYADSHGFQRDDLRDIWAYRDWVIRALNADMPFDQFTIEQIAGDLLPDATESQRVATGFHRCTPTNVEAGSLPEETRTEQVIDRVNTTGAVWLGTTLECCQCHDHKYDPFSMKEYYQLLAFFNNTELEADRADPKKPSSIKFQGPSMPLSDGERDQQRARLRNEMAELKQQLLVRRETLNADLTTWSRSLSRGQLPTIATAHRLQIIEFTSASDTDTFRELADGSILLSADLPADKETYTLRLRGQIQGVRGLRLEALQHPELPGMGPGRGDPTRTNFVLNEFKASYLADASENVTQQPTELKFSSATASFSQQNFDVKQAIDGDAKSGWAIAPRFDQSHWANFAFEQPIDLTSAGELRVELSQQFGKARTIGCLRVSAITGDPQAELLAADVLQVASKSPGSWSQAERDKLLDYRAGRDEKYIQLQREVSQLQKRLDELPSPTTLVMVELPQPRPATVFIRGDYQQPGEAVEPGTPAVLHGLSGETGEAEIGSAQQANRLALARWLVDRRNPLVARVTVNRLWAEVFGRGIVSTVEDFGVKGEPPTHPELLDWLAVEFMDSGWSIKHILRTIVLSATYQQASQISPELRERDPLNQLLARGPRFRMDAEMIRDNALAISGLLDLKQFGPPIRPYQPAGLWTKVGGEKYDYQVSPGGEQYRRGVYVVLKRGAPFPSFVSFDASARLACVVKRSRTNTPLQALTLLNDPVYVDAAQGLVQRVMREAGDKSIRQQIQYAFRLSVARPPTERELDVLAELHAELTATSPSADQAWYGVATTLLNLHETITKD